MQFEQSVIKILQSGGIGVIPTDTIYGLVGRAELKETVERIYAVRNRDHTKPCIILISEFEDLEKFTISLKTSEADIIQKLWPGKVSIVLSVFDPQFEYLTRETQTLAFRIPDEPHLRALIKETGPLIAPSANLEGQKPAESILTAQSVFDDHIDFYVDGGMIQSEPSTLIILEDNTFRVLRPGAVTLTF